MLKVTRWKQQAAIRCFCRVKDDKMHGAGSNLLLCHLEDDKTDGADRVGGTLTSLHTTPILGSMLEVCLSLGYRVRGMSMFTVQQWRYVYVEGTGKEVCLSLGYRSVSVIVCQSQQVSPHQLLLQHS